MRLDERFYQLPIQFDPARLQEEVAALPPEAWAPHPDRVAGNSAARLITAHGEENDAVYGQMLPTRWLAQMPYVRQVLASFGVVWSRSRLMRLAPGAEVPEHADINYHWHTRVRMHVPVFTREEVRFHCDGESVHMAAGEAWIFDNWRRHHVENPSPAERIHLVADTTGTAAFWNFACSPPPPRAQWRKLAFRPEANPRLLTETCLRPAIMPPAEVQWLIDDWIGELAPSSRDSEPQIAALTRHMRDFVRDWRQLCAMHGDNPRARPAFIGMAGGMRATGRTAIARSGDAHQRGRRDARAAKATAAAPRNGRIAPARPRIVRIHRYLVYTNFQHRMFLMPSPRTALLATLLGAAANLGLAGTALGQDRQDGQVVRHVIVIGVDAMSPDGIRHAETPVIDEMMASGAWTMNARGVLPTSSSANWASMLTGAGPEQHGVTSNDWRVGEFNFPTMVAGSGNFYPSIFQLLTEQHPEWEVGSIYDWDGFGNLYDHRFVDHDESRPGHVQTTAAVVDYIKSSRPNFLFMHLDQPDHDGHTFGHGTPEYYASVASADAEIGLIRQAVADAGIADDTVIIVTADHGGVGKGHGGDSLAELEIPWIASGAGIAAGRELTLPVNTYDTPATAAWLLGLDIPYAWIGRPVRPALAREDMPAQTYRLSSSYPAPIISPLADGNDPAGGLFTNGPAELTIANPNPVGEVRFTLDGSNPTATSPLYRGPVAIEHSTVVRTALFIDGSQASVPSAGYFRVLQPSDEPRGLTWKAYVLPETPVRLPDFSRLEPVASGVTHEVSLSGLDLPRGHSVAVTFEGFIDIPTSGKYDFFTASDDGSKLYIDGNAVVDNDGDHGVIMANGSIELAAGRHAFRAEWFNGGGGAWVGAWFQGPGIVRQFIDPNLFTPR